MSTICFTQQEYDFIHDFDLPFDEDSTIAVVEALRLRPELKGSAYLVEALRLMENDT